MHSQCSLPASKTSELFYWQDLTYLWNATVQGCVFFVMGRRKASTDVEISQSTIRYLSRHKHTHRLTANKKSTKFPPFSVSQCFFFLLQSQGRVYGGEWCVNVGYQTRIKGWITPVWCVSSATSLECYSCSAESSDNCVVKQQCSGGDDSCLQLSSNGTALIKHSDVDDVQTPSRLLRLRQKTGEKRSKSQDFASATCNARAGKALCVNRSTASLPRFPKHFDKTQKKYQKPSLIRPAELTCAELV